MKGVDWGSLYEEFSNTELDADSLESEIVELIVMDDITFKKGIYQYVLIRKEYSWI